MSESSLTLREMFSIPSSGVLSLAPNSHTGIEESIRGRFKGIELTTAVQHVTPKVDQLFDIEVSDILLDVWHKAWEIQAVQLESKNKRKEVFFVALAKHSVDSVHHPYIEMRYQHFPPKKILEFTIRVSMTLESFELKIQEGEIKEVRTGQLEVEGTIELWGQVLKKKELGQIKLPGTIVLTPQRPTSATKLPRFPGS